MPEYFVELMAPDMRGGQLIVYFATVHAVNPAQAITHACTLYSGRTYTKPPRYAEQLARERQERMAKVM